MTVIPIVIAAVLPVAILIYYIYYKDPVKEPPMQLVRGFGYGLIAAVIAVVVEVLLQVVGIVSAEPDGVLSSINLAFVGAAIPEEAAKLLMLWLLLRKNRHFDEYFDGVVYAASIGLGFAAIENVGYLFGNIDQWLGVAVMRGIFSVPAHFAFAVIMGYFYSLIHIGGRHTRRNMFLVIAAPVSAHGAFDAALMAATVGDIAAVVFAVLFLIVCWRLVIVCKRHIRTMRAFDSIPKAPVPPPFPPVYPPTDNYQNNY